MRKFAKAGGPLLIGLMLLVGCKKDKEVEPDTRSLLTSKWWCHDNQLLADLNFNPDGAVQERTEGQIQSGRWTLSEDESTIEIIQAGGNNQGTRTFGLRSVDADKLVLVFFGEDNAYSKCQ